MLFNHRIQGQTNGNHSVTKITNKQGFINLGTLVDVLSIRVDTDIGARANWDLQF